ncbi:putative duf803 domain-containing protein [Golovinomyces cichoracearum]|uniref:Putative duf803 domain-containing protein n=1 Tax=Golovinomyces cichoracearum TaxID=62708 RepID=A0A420HHD1_9PEZI|nr:putative duf803 domain-containing protein [Golovinomyces cichoracearum]
MGILGDLSPGGSIAIGILVGLVSTNVQSIGLTLQRKSHLLEDEAFPCGAGRPAYLRRRWQLGMGMFIISNLIGSAIQITTLPLPVLSTLQASGLVFNSICATFILGEPFTCWSLGGTLLVSSGAVLIATFGAIPEPAHNLDQLLILLARWNFVIWMILQFITVLGIAAIAEFLAHLPNQSSKPRIRLWCGLAYGGISGILSAHSLLVAKSAVELLVRTIVDRVNQFNRWQSWAILLGLVLLALTQLYYLHQGLKLVSSSVLYPLVFCVYNIIAIFDGLIYFKQTDRLKPAQASLIGLGTVILLSGVLALSWQLSDDQSQLPVTKSALAPGLGFIENTDNDEYSDFVEAQDESNTSSEHQPLLNSRSADTKNKKNIFRVYLARNSCDDSYKSKQQDERYNPWHVPEPQKQSNKLVALPEPYYPHDEETRVWLKPQNRRRRSTGFHGFIARSVPKIKRRRIYPEISGGEFWKMNWLGGFKSSRVNSNLEPFSSNEIPHDDIESNGNSDEDNDAQPV